MKRGNQTLGDSPEVDAFFFFFFWRKFILDPFGT